MQLAGDVHVTTAILWRGTAVFAIADLALLSALGGRVTRSRFHELRGTVLVVTAVFWFVLWLSLASLLDWDSVYSYVFPPWSRWLLPVGQAALTTGVAAVAVALASRLPGRPVVTYCLLGGVWGSVAHVWAVFRGIVEKPPILQGASPLAAVIVAFFEFTLYFCAIIGISLLIRRLHVAPGSADGVARVP
jgi:hypothetical protein